MVLVLMKIMTTMMSRMMVMVKNLEPAMVSILCWLPAFPLYQVNLL